MSPPNSNTLAWHHELAGLPDDAPLNGAEEIGAAAGIFKGEEVDLGRTFYLLENGSLPASKIGKGGWVSTLGRVRSVYRGEAGAREARS
jgi:hypothetical protein